MNVTNWTNRQDSKILGSKILGSFLGVAACLLICNSALAQQSEQENKKTIAQESVVAEVEIVNQDGEKVSPRIFQFRRDGAAGAVGAGANVTINKEDGKILIIEADGTKREIDVSGAKSITVNQSVQSVMKDGQKQTQTMGKAIVIGPDGVRQEFELSNPGAGQWKGQLPGMVHFEQQELSKFMIGVNCKPISESLSSQLNLESGTGLVVDFVGDDTPSATAGLQVHDILMFADDKRLVETSDLVAAVQQAGKDDVKLSLTVVRGGKEIGVEVEAVERPQSKMLDFPAGLQVMPGIAGDQFELQFKQMGPGVIIGENFMRDDLQQKMQQQMEEMQAEIQRMQKLMREQMDIDK